VKAPPVGVNRENFVSISAYAFWCFLRGKTGSNGFLNAAKSKYSPDRVEAVKSVWRILAFFSMVPFFWALNDQNSSEWVLQAKKMDLHFLGHTWLAEQIQSINAILVLVFIPFYSYALFPWLRNKGVNLSPHRKVGAGFILTILSFVIIYYIQLQLDGGFTPNIGWQVLAYIILTAAEVLIYQTGLEYAYTQAPASMKSTIMSFWLLTISIGNYIVSLVNSSIANKGICSHLEGANFFLFFIGLMSAATLAFFVMARNKPAH
jgi:POT family proton-dependent oligopeptide transporter